MLNKFEELKQLCEAEIRSLKHQINMAKAPFFPRWDAKSTIQKAEVKLEKIQELLAKLEALSEQVNPVVTDIKEILGLERHAATKSQNKQ
ncbi:hypothetical protein Dred_1609 [Desulforamulus reducens MI-1]|uniref:Uncharacterized protein n=1 Tax=Desulforamulus reducens (strain ATCC BAA-1160 / DSM 100696 / MI-1) TaxID=349161 RepID=A4J4Y4_DESRM|nr:hypothetical protein [Desulforamulus reducens]ABO50137.1 hypothetical protein Dred_1609 [Desulforamulus reducens MI-1]